MRNTNNIIYDNFNSIETFVNENTGINLYSPIEINDYEKLNDINNNLTSKDLYQEIHTQMNEIININEHLLESSKPVYMKEESNDDINHSLTVNDGNENSEESAPKKIDKVESDKNGIRRKNLYMAFIKWAKSINVKNTFSSIFDKDAFTVSYPFIPHDMRYFYRLANPMLCVLTGDLTFFSASELKKINIHNNKLNELLIFAATTEDVRVFNKKDNKIYKGIDNNGIIEMKEVLSETFDTYIEHMIDKGNILSAE